MSEGIEQPNPIIPRISYFIEGDRFKFFVGKDLIFSILMQVSSVPIFSWASKAQCLYSIFRDNPELLQLFLFQLDNEGKI